MSSYCNLRKNNCWNAVRVTYKLYKHTQNYDPSVLSSTAISHHTTHSHTLDKNRLSVGMVLSWNLFLRACVYAETNISYSLSRQYSHKAVCVFIASGSQHAVDEYLADISEHRLSGSSFWETSHCSFARVDTMRLAGAGEITMYEVLSLFEGLSKCEAC